MNDEELKNSTETLSADEQKVSRLLKSLARAEAPNDFDFRLKARLANTESNKQRRRRTAWAYRYALPILAVAMLFSVMAYQGNFWSSTNSQPLANSARPETPGAAPTVDQLVAVASTPAATLTPETFASNTAERPSPEIEKYELAVKNPKNTRTAVKPVAENDNFNGSQVSGVRLAPVIVPKSNANSGLPNLESFVQPVPQSAAEVLSFIGIKTSLENGKLKVQKVEPNSLAERSGVQPNDLIESLNNQTVTPATVFTNKFEGKTITVSRGGEKREIKLQNK